MVKCMVAWGSHACKLDRGHDIPCECEECECDPHHVSLDHEDSEGCVEKSPYYGPETNFYIPAIKGTTQTEVPGVTREAALRNLTPDEWRVYKEKQN